MKIEANLLWSDIAVRNVGDGAPLLVQPNGNNGNISFTRQKSMVCPNFDR